MAGRPAFRPGAMLAAMTHPDTAAGPTRALGADFAAPITDRYFEDYEPGAVYEYGYLSVTEAEILDFARRFDPQPMHTDRAWAAAGPFGGLIASGWHTAGLFMRLYADHYLTRVASLASPGIDELRWPAPLRPGDPLRIRAEVAEARPSRSKPGRGLVRTRCELIAGPDTTVMTALAMNLIARRPG
jgi:acyl dehydratase